MVDLKAKPFCLTDEEIRRMQEDRVQNGKGDTK